MPISFLGTCLPQIKVDEVLRLVGHVGPKVAAHDAVPGGVVLLVKLLLDEGRNVLRDEQGHGGHESESYNDVTTQQYVLLFTKKASDVMWEKGKKLQ